MDETHLAEKLYDWMNSLRSKEGTWVVDSHYFLPANVLCDFAGKATFIRGMADVIKICQKED